jgi:ketosteroid isomerase-like protein
MPAYVRVLLSGVLITLVALGACAAQKPDSSLGQRPTQIVRTPTAQPATDEEAIRQLILLEGQGVVSQDIEGLMNLWADDAAVTDAKHTPDEADDDAHWRGKDAIRERYVVLVFPGSPAAAGDKDIRLTMKGDTAFATATTVIGGEVSPGGDYWTFVKRAGRWWIEGLTYNLESETAAP